MRERLYLAGCPTTPAGWIIFGLLMLAALAYTFYWGDGFLAALIVGTWLVKLVTVHWSDQNRLLCQLFLWVLLWRAHAPAQPWYLVVPAAALLAGSETFIEAMRRTETDR